MLFVQFSGALSTTAAQNLDAYTVFSGKIKRTRVPAGAAQPAAVLVFPVFSAAKMPAASSELLDFLLTLPTARRQPNLFLAAIIRPDSCND